MPVPSRYLRDLREAEVSLAEAPLGLYNMVRYQAGMRGRTRHLPGLLCLAACRAVGGDPRRALPAATALDMAYAYFDLHYNLWSRRLSSIWRRWGQAQAINAGDALFTLARLRLLDLEREGVTTDRASEALRLLDEACLRACWGRSLELDPQKQALRPGSGQGQEDEAEVAKLAWERASVLLRCSIEIGALLGGASKSSRERLGDFGQRMGAVLFLRKADAGENAVLASRYRREALEVLEVALPPSRQTEMRELVAFALGGRGEGGSS